MTGGAEATMNSAGNASRGSLLSPKTEQGKTHGNNTLLQLNEFFVKSIPSGKLLRYNGASDKSEYEWEKNI